MDDVISESDGQECGGERRTLKVTHQGAARNRRRNLISTIASFVFLSSYALLSGSYKPEFSGFLAVIPELAFLLTLS